MYNGGGSILTITRWTLTVKEGIGVAVAVSSFASLRHSPLTTMVLFCKEKMHRAIGIIASLKLFLRMIDALKVVSLHIGQRMTAHGMKLLIGVTGLL